MGVYFDMSMCCNNCTNCQLIYDFVYYDNQQRFEKFKKLFKDPDKLYKLALHNLLTNDQMNLLYNRHKKYFFNKSKNIFDLYYQYCYVFNDFLSKKEREILLNKLMTDDFKHRITFALKDLSLPRDDIDKLNSFMIYDLLTPNL